MNSLITDLERVDLKCDSAYDELLSIFSRKIVPMYGYKLKKESTPSLIRSRINDDNVDYYNFKDIYYPPSDKVLEFSRANKPLQNLLYVSDRFDTNLAELKLFVNRRLQENEKLLITSGIWVINEDLDVAIIPDFTNKTMNKYFIGSLTSEEYEFYAVLNKYFKMDAYNNINIYKVTSAFCNAIFSKCLQNNLPCDGVMFTSVQAGVGFNIALNPSVVDNQKICLVNSFKQYIRKRTNSDKEPVIDNFVKPILAKSLDYDNERIYW